MNMINGKTLKILGVVASVAGMGISLVSDKISDKLLEEKIAEKAAKAVEDLVNKN